MAVFDDPNKSDEKKRLDFLKDEGVEPIGFNGNTASGWLHDGLEHLAGYPSLKSFNYYIDGTWKAENAPDNNKGFERWIENSFDGSASDLQNIIDLRIKNVDDLVNSLRNIEPSQAQYWLGHKKWLESYSIKNSTITEPRRKLKVVHYAATYLLECLALNEPLPFEKGKIELEEIGVKRLEPIGRSGNRFYRVLRENFNFDLNDSDKWERLLGCDWKEIVLELSICKSELEKYLKEKQM